MIIKASAHLKNRVSILRIQKDYSHSYPQLSTVIFVFIE